MHIDVYMHIYMCVYMDIYYVQNKKISPMCHARSSLGYQCCVSEQGIK